MKNLEVIIDLKEHFVQLKDTSNILIERKVEFTHSYVITIGNFYDSETYVNIEYHGGTKLEEDCKEFQASIEDLFYGTNIRVITGPDDILPSVSIFIPEEYTLSIKREAGK